MASADDTPCMERSSFLAFTDYLKLPEDAGQGIDTSEIDLQWIMDKIQTCRILPAEVDTLFPLYEDDAYITFLKDVNFKFDTGHERRLKYLCIEKPARQLFREEGVGLAKCCQMTQALDIPSGFAMAAYDTWLALVTAEAVNKLVGWKERHCCNRLMSDFANKIISVLYKNYARIKAALDAKVKRKFEQDAEELADDYQSATRAAKRSRTDPLDF